MSKFATALLTALLGGFSALFPVVTHGAIPDRFSSLDPDPGGQGSLGLLLEIDQDLIPAFRAGPRDRVSAGFQGRWMVADRVLFEARWPMIMDLHPDGHRETGPGDLELGTTLRLPIAEGLRTAARDAGRQGPSFGLGWRVKLPNAADEGELGSDETDVTVHAVAAGDLGPLRGWAGGGLAILGDPGKLAAQDDIVFLQAGLAWSAPAERSPWLPALSASGGVALPSAANPTRAGLDAGLAWGQRWRVALGAGAGLTAASPTALFSLGIEHRFGLDAPGNGTQDQR